MRINSVSVFCDKNDIPSCKVKCFSDKDCSIEFYKQINYSRIVSAPPFVTFFLESIHDLIQLRDSINYSINKAIKDFSNESS